MANARPTYDGASYRPKEDDHRRKITEAIDRVNAGKINCVTDLTLAANASSTALTDARIGYFSAILLMPMTANAAAEMGAKVLAQPPVVFETGAVATGTTAFPVNNVIPVNTAGDQYMAATITPTNAGSTLLIDVVWNGANSTFNPHGCALFQDATANALAAVPFNPQSANQVFTIAFRHKMIAGTTSPITFKVRAGSNAGPTTTFNGQGGAGIFGGVLASSITITEVLPAAPLSIAQGTMLKGSAVIAHQNNPQTDRTFRAVILG